MFAGCKVAKFVRQLKLQRQLESSQKIANEPPSLPLVSNFIRSPRRSTPSASASASASSSASPSPAKSPPRETYQSIEIPSSHDRRMEQLAHDDQQMSDTDLKATRS